MQLKSFRLPLLVIAALLFVYSVYWSYVVLSGPLPSFDLRGHLYFAVSAASVVVWPLVFFSNSLGTAIIVLFVSLISSHFGIYFGVRFSEPPEIAIAIYLGAFMIFCWALLHMLKNLWCSHDSLMVAFCGVVAAIFLISFIWFILKTGCQPKAGPSVFYGISAQYDEFLLMAVYALLLMSGVMYLSVPLARSVWLVEIVLFFAVIHSFSLGGFKTWRLGEVLAVVMVLVASVVPIYALTQLKRG